MRIGPWIMRRPRAVARAGIASAIALSTAALVAIAATPADAQRAPSPRAADPHRDLPRSLERLPAQQMPEETRGLDFLFEALKAAPDKASAKHVEARIMALWASTPSDTVALLMGRVKTAIEHKDVPLALKLLDAIVQIRPDYVEGWNRRATLHLLANDQARALADIRQVLVREPRHFAALVGLGMILRDLGEEARALDAFRRAIEINPHLDRVIDQIKTLREKVEGRDI